MKSIAIMRIIAEARNSGNEIESTSHGWEYAVEVAHMSCPMSSEIRTKFSSEPNLSYWREDGTPHNAPEEGFYDEFTKEGIVFPFDRH